MGCTEEDRLICGVDGLGCVGVVVVLDTCGEFLLLMTLGLSVLLPGCFDEALLPAVTCFEAVSIAFFGLATAGGFPIGELVLSRIVPSGVFICFGITIGCEGFFVMGLFGFKLSVLGCTVTGLALSVVLTPLLLF